VERKALACAVLIGAVSALTGSSAAVADTAAAHKTQHCSMTVLDENVDGSLRTTPIVCGPVAISATASDPVLAIHYTGFNWTGSTLTIYGGVCGGGWLNLPGGWVNAIASTRSWCTTTHYEGMSLTGAYVTTFGPGGNLGSLAYAVDSVVYN
jgi:hypothetical protein